MRRLTRSIAWLACLTASFCGCADPASTEPLNDPTSNAPALAGRWCLQTEEQGFVGFFELSETGDPESVRDNPLAIASLGVDELILDGQPHTTDQGFQYTATAFAALDDTTMTLSFDVRVFAFGVESGALSLQFEGTRGSDDRVEGIAVTLQDFPGIETQDLAIERATATRNVCE